MRTKLQILRNQHSSQKNDNYSLRIILVFIISLFLLSQSGFAQNVGIGTTTPQGELHVSRPYNWQGVTFSGSGLDDITVDHSNYTGTTERTYIIIVSNDGPDPNKFDWSDDSGSTWTTDVDMSETPISLSYGIEVYWDDDYGHTYNDQWTFTIGPDYLNGLIVKNAQVGIGTDSPASCAKLEISGSDKGVLVPKTDTTTVNNANVGSLETGLLIYQNSDNTFYYFNGTSWLKLVTQDAVFERNGTTVRQKGHYGTDDFVFGRDSLPQNGEMVSDTLFFFDQSKGAFRGGISTNQTDWSPDSLGQGSFAYGNSVNAKGKYSVAIGNSSYANGDYSIAIGRGILTPSGYETALGRYNTSYTPLSETGWNDNDRLFTIGKGTLFTRENALTMLKNGNTGLGTENPLSKLSVNGDGNQLWTFSAYNSDMNGRAVYGNATANNPYSYNYGGYFESAGDNGAGVYGLSSNTTGSFGNGGYFESYGEYGNGVYGSTSGASGSGIYGSAYNSGDVINYGGYFTAQGINGIGAYGQALGNAGLGIVGIATNSGDYTNYGGKFSAWGSTGRGVYGIAENTGDVQNYGGYFEAKGHSGIGVYGIAEATTNGSKYGGKFIANGDGGTGVYGESSGYNGTGVQGQTTEEEGKAIFGVANNPTGMSYGVYGYNNSPDGYGGFFVGKGFFSGKVGIGVEDPETELEINGQIKITGGNPGEGKVLTSDGSGKATWKANQNRASIGTTMATVYMDQHNMFDPHIDDCNGTTQSFVEIFFDADVGFCIEKDERAEQNWSDAVIECLEDGMRLPEPWEWQLACDRKDDLGLINMENNWEWASNFAIPMFDDSYRAIGVAVYNSCNTGGWYPTNSATGLRPKNEFRCVR